LLNPERQQGGLLDQGTIRRRQFAADLPLEGGDNGLVPTRAGGPAIWP
jgi:hypothetical protein